MFKRVIFLVCVGARMVFSQDSQNPKDSNKIQIYRSTKEFLEKNPQYKKDSKATQARGAKGRELKSTQSLERTRGLRRNESVKKDSKSDSLKKNIKNTSSKNLDSKKLLTKQKSVKQNEKMPIKITDFLSKNPQLIDLIYEAKMHDFTRNKKVKNKIKAKMESKKDLRIRLLGDSHIASDFMANEMRNILENIDSIGFSYPLMPNHHQNILLEYKSKDFGIIDSRIPSNKLKDMIQNLGLPKKLLNFPIDFPLGGIIAYPEKTNSDFLPMININVSKKVTNKKFIVDMVFKSGNKNIAFSIKDSKNKMYYIKSTKNNPKKTSRWEIATLNLTFPIQITAHNYHALLGGFFIHNDEHNENKNNIIESIGLNGVRSDIWEKWDKNILNRELKILKYDIIMLCYGSNDAMYDKFDEKKFIANYRAFISLLRKHNKNPLIILISPLRVESKTFEAIKKAIKKVARLEKTMLFDMDEFMQDAGNFGISRVDLNGSDSKNSNIIESKTKGSNISKISKTKPKERIAKNSLAKEFWIENKLSKEDIHLTYKGYHLMSQAIFYAFKRCLNSP